MGKRKKTKIISLAILIMFLSVLATESLFAYGGGSDRASESTTSTVPTERNTAPSGFTPKQASIILTNFLIQQGPGAAFGGLSFVQWVGDDQPGSANPGNGASEGDLTGKITKDVKAQEGNGQSTTSPMTDREVRIAANAFLSSLSAEDKKNLQANFTSFEILNIQYVREVKESAAHETNPVIRNYMNNLVQQAESDILTHANDRRQSMAQNQQAAMENINRINDFFGGAAFNIITAPFGTGGAVINIIVNTAMGGTRGLRTSITSTVVRSLVNIVLPGSGILPIQPIEDAVIQEAAVVAIDWSEK